MAGFYQVNQKARNLFNKIILFKKFSRGKGGKLTYTGGTGLGLYLAAKIIEAHHGRIWAESEGVGKGSTFFFEVGKGE